MENDRKYESKCINIYYAEKTENNSIALLLHEQKLKKKKPLLLLDRMQRRVGYHGKKIKKILTGIGRG